MPDPSGFMYSSGTIRDAAVEIGGRGQASAFSAEAAWRLGLDMTDSWERMDAYKNIAIAIMTYLHCVVTSGRKTRVDPCHPWDVGCQVVWATAEDGTVCEKCGKKDIVD